MSNIGSYVDEKIIPVVAKISENKVIKSIQNGAMATMPLTLGVSILAILLNLPITPWTNWLAETGINTHMAATIKVTMEIGALYMSFMIGYFNSNLRGSSGLTGGILALACFLILTPHTIPTEGGGFVAGLNFDFLGGQGIFGGMIVAILISSLYVTLDKKGLVIKLPESVPPMVTQSLSPTLIAMIIFILTFLIRVGFAQTDYGNFFTFISSVLGTPITQLGSSVPSVMIFAILQNVFWFFGIHPMTLMSVYMPVLMTVGVANLTAFMSGQPLPNLMFSAVFAYLQVGGTGNTLGLGMVMPFLAKSERYRTLGRLAAVPGIFNINEPLIFGMPIMLNPLFFIPMVLTAIVNVLLGYGAYLIGVYATYNPTIALPWIVPAFVTPFFTIGIIGVIAMITVIIIDTLIYLPFFKKADRLAVLEENDLNN